MSRTLHPAILDELGLVSAIESECMAVSKRDGIRIAFEAKRVPKTLPKDVSLNLYRIAQEGLRNIAKHARTEKAAVRLTGAGRKVRLVIQDFGAGFDPQVVPGKGGLGLASIRERVRFIQGQCSIKSRLGHGTMIQVDVPLRGGKR
jgi:signal transduction histidine kinase